ncbi:MAG: hypothetical protein DWQ06_09355 [Calditrichaeota bacterium]|nr:MAG: hypothetical protein DWQ06_09355 [Calditrichota bacterium]
MQEFETLETQTNEIELFKSQIEVKNKISNFLTKETENNTLVLFGENKCGKTFLLKNLVENPQKGIKPFYFDFDFKNDFRTAELLKEISDVIKLTHKEYSFSGLDEKLTLFLDNFFIPQNEEKLFNELTELASKNPKIKFILSSSFSEDSLNSLNPSFRKNSEFVHLQYLNFEDVSKFLKTFSNPKFTPDAINRIFSLTEGHPFISEKIGEYLFNHSKIKGINSISKNEVDKNLIAVIKGLKDELFWFHNELNASEKTFLFIIADQILGGGKTDFKTLKEELDKILPKAMEIKAQTILDNLTKLNIIKKQSKNEFNLRIPLFNKWAESEFEKDALKSELVKFQKLISMYLDLGKIQFENEDYQEAKKNFLKVVQQNPDNFEAFQLLAIVYQKGKFGSDERILNFYEKAYSLKPEKVKKDFLNFLLEYSQKEPSNFGVLEKLLAIEPNNPESQKRLLNYYFIKWEKELANQNFDSFQKAINTQNWILTDFKDEVLEYILNIFPYFSKSNKIEEFNSILLELTNKEKPVQLKEKLLETYLNDWKEKSQMGIYEPIIQVLESETWLIENYFEKLDSYFEELIEQLLLNENFENVVKVFEIVPNNFDHNKLYPFVKKANEMIKSELTDLIQNIESVSFEEANERGFKEGEKIGFKEGLADGKTKGILNGKKIGYEKGFKDGFEEGNTKGYEKGYVLGKNDGY